tara:strand:- start:71 stop:463 length:393 start_codon:yes stop_codon:yes gene_type:complete
MKLGLLIGKWGLILIIWILILLTLKGGIDEMTLIQFSIGLLYAISIVTIAFAVFNFAENPRAGMKFIISALSLGLIFLIGYNFSSDQLDQEGNLIEGSKLSEGGIYSLYVVTIIAVLLIVATEVKRALKL